MSRVLSSSLLVLALPARAADDGTVRFLDVTTWGVMLLVFVALLFGGRTLARWVRDNAEPALADLQGRLRHPSRVLPWTASEAPIMDGAPLGGGAVRRFQGQPAAVLAGRLAELADTAVIVGVHGDTLLASTQPVDPRWRGRLFRLPDALDAGVVMRLAGLGRPVLVIDQPPGAEVLEAVTRCDGAVLVVAPEAPAVGGREAP